MPWATALADRGPIPIPNWPRIWVITLVDNVPDHIISSRAEWTTDVAHYMTARGSPPGVESRWALVTEAIARLAMAYRAAARELAPIDPAERTDSGIVPLYIHDYPALGRAIDAETVARLEEACEALVGTLHRPRHNPLSPAEIDLLRQLIDGRAVSDLAADLGLSDRSVYRTLRDIWIRVGASSRNEGVAIVTARGWLEPEPGPGPEPDRGVSLKPAGRPRRRSSGERGRR